MSDDTIELATVIAAKLAERLESNFQVMPTLTLSQAAEALGVSEEKMRPLRQSLQPVICWEWIRQKTSPPGFVGQLKLLNKECLKPTNS